MESDRKVTLEAKHIPANCPDCELLYIAYRCGKDGAVYRVAPMIRSDEPPFVIAYQCTYEERFEQTLEGIKRMHPYVDAIVIVHDGSLSTEHMDFLANDYPKVHLFYKPWVDDFPNYRNEALKRAAEIAKEKNALANLWVLVSDPDEVFCEEFLKDTHSIAERSGGGTIFNMCKINSRDKWIYPDHVEEIQSTFYKDLFFKYEKVVRYVGVGKRLVDGKEVLGGMVHETLSPPIMGWKPIFLPEKYFYTHSKTHQEITERAARNFWINGGGNNELTDDWKELRKIAKPAGFPEDWTHAREAFRRGNVPQVIKDWLVRHRSDNDRPNVDVEMRDFFTWYFVYLHPEENTGNWKSEPKEPPRGTVGELERYIRQTYREILGRDADDSGLSNYVSLISNGVITREQLKEVLMNSDEYGARKKGEAIR